MKSELFDPLASEEGQNSFCFVAKDSKTVLFITDDTLNLLWEQAQQSLRGSSGTCCDGNYLLPKKDWIISQSRPGDSGRRRVYDKFAVLVFHEAEALTAEPRNVQGTEPQAFNAFCTYLGGHTTFVFVYAFTSFGTKIEHGSAIGWVQPGQYVEVNSSERRLIRQVVEAMKIAAC
ncbi:hypothetical protein N7504_006394 [Penicillium tannophilum]|nr:hypothetical protein N7504_006394 [Penicillium tannophilum]